MQDEFVDVYDAATHIAIWGIARKEDLRVCEELVLLIPGNPGLIGYYREFLDEIYSYLKIPICAISHAGHEQPTGNAATGSRKESYNIEFQIQHKTAFIRTYIPKHVRIYLIGHSVGCKMILDMLKNEEINKRVVKCYLLFPTIERISESPNGKFLTKFILPITSVILFLSWLFTLFPAKLQRGLVYSYFLVRGSGASSVEVTTQLINPDILRNVFFLAHDEMINVKELDHYAIESSKEKLFLYYGATDNWTPVTYFEDLINVHPTVNAQLCSKNFEHAFVLSSSKEMGLCVAEVIKSDRLNHGKS